MSKYTQIHGAAWDDHIANSSSALGRGWSMEDGMGLLTDQTGFRLVHDGGNQLAQGGFWDASGCSHPVCSRFRADTIKSFVGFRLVREEDT